MKYIINFLRETHNNMFFHHLRSMFTKTTTPKDLKKNVNVARMIGAISSEVFSSDVSKTRMFYLRTFNHDNFYDTHKIVVPAYAVENMPGIAKTGQNILVTGKLRTNYFTQNNGKRGTSIHIIAKQIYLCDNCKSDELNKKYPFYADVNEENKLSKTQFTCGVTNFDIKDQNHIEIMAQICFDILNDNSHSTFNLALHYLSKNSDGREVEETDFIPVFAYNESLRNIIRTQLKRLDRVRVEGVLKYKSCVDNTGKRQYKSYIEANKIAKLTRINTMQSM